MRHHSSVSAYALFSIFLAGILSGCFLLPSDEGEFENAGPFLTWQQDPTSTVTIDWYAHEGDQEARFISYRRINSEANWRRVESTQHEIPSSEYVIHRAELSGLGADTKYEFRIPLGEFHFRTLPETLSRLVQLAAGGDVRHRQSWMEGTNRQVAKHDVDLVIWGGDLAYADARSDRLYRWREFFEATHNTLIQDDGRVIPVLAAIGNREVRKGYFREHDGY